MCVVGVDACAGTRNQVRRRTGPAKLIGLADPIPPHSRATVAKTFPPGGMLPASLQIDPPGGETCPVDVCLERPG